jgi:hypothetical protein
VLQLRGHCYFAPTGSGSYVLADEGLLRLDESVDPEVVDAVMPELATGRPFDHVSEELAAEHQASANRLLNVLLYHGLIESGAEGSAECPELADVAQSEECFVVSGPGEACAAFAASLRECGLEVRVGESSTSAGLSIWMVGGSDGERRRICQVAATGEGVCWSFVENSDEPLVHLPLAALRRSESLAPPGPIPDAMPPTALKVAAKQIAYQLRRPRRTQAPTGTLTFLDGLTLLSSTHKAVPHPYQVPTRHEAREHGHRISNDELTERWQQLSDDRFGAFTELSEANLSQLPLKVTLARTSDPCGLLRSSPTVVGVGTDRARARGRAILEAVGAYGSLVIDPRRLLDRNGGNLCDDDSDPVIALEKVRERSIDAFVRAADLHDGQERLILAQEAFPILERRPAITTPCGTSAAIDWQGALINGLLQHCVRLTVASRGSRRPEIRLLDITDFDSDAEVGFLSAMVHAARVHLTLEDITGALGVPVVSATSSSGPTVYGGGGRMVDAVKQALMGTLYCYQWRQDAALRAVMTTPKGDIWTDPSGSSGSSPNCLVESLRHQGYTASVVALDHDREVHELFPYTLRVVVTSGPEGSDHQAPDTDQH